MATEQKINSNWLVYFGFHEGKWELITKLKFDFRCSIANAPNLVPEM